MREWYLTSESVEVSKKKYNPGPFAPFPIPHSPPPPRRVPVVTREDVRRRITTDIEDDYMTLSKKILKTYTDHRGRQWRAAINLPQEDWKFLRNNKEHLMRELEEELFQTLENEGVLDSPDDYQSSFRW